MFEFVKIQPAESKNSYLEFISQGKELKIDLKESLMLKNFCWLSDMKRTKIFTVHPDFFLASKKSYS